MEKVDFWISLSFLIFIINLLITYFWLCLVFTVAHGLSLAVVSGGYSLVAVRGLFTAVASLVAEHGLQSSGTGAVARGFSCPLGLVAPWV